MGVLDTFRRSAKETKGPPPKTVTAAAMPMSGPGVRRIDQGRNRTTQEQWQREGWYYFDVIGELRAPLVWIANAISQADLHATELDPATGKPTGPSEDPIAMAAAAQAFGGASQLAQNMRLVSLCWQVAGEAWIIVRPQGAGLPDKWLVLSGEQVAAKGTTWTYTDPMTQRPVTLGPNDLLIRVLQPHPNNQAKADSAVRTALPICREVEKASQNIAARLDSRIATNGLMAIANEVDFPGGPSAFMEQLLGTAEHGLQNPGHASSQVPMGFNAPGELIANDGVLKHYDISTQFDASVVELRRDGLVRLAATLDMPNDVAEGSQGESNHWSSWKVEEDTYKIFIEPTLKAIGDAVTEYWYRPAMVAMGKTPEQAARFELGWDTVSIVARPDDRETLDSAYDKILVSDEYYLTENGLPLDALPDDEERRRRLLEKLVISSPAILSEAGVAAMLGLPEIEAAQDDAAEQAREVEERAPEESPRALPATRDAEPEPEAVPEGLVAAAEVLVKQALHRAGGRLLTNQNRGQFKDVPRHELYQHIRPTSLEGLIEIQFASGVAESFGVSRSRLAGGLGLYVEHLLKTGGVHSRDEMIWYLR